MTIRQHLCRCMARTRHGMVGGVKRLNKCLSKDILTITIFIYGPHIRYAFRVKLIFLYSCLSFGRLKNTHLRQRKGTKNSPCIAHYFDCFSFRPADASWWNYVLVCIALIEANQHVWSSVFFFYQFCITCHNHAHKKTGRSFKAVYYCHVSRCNRVSLINRHAKTTGRQWIFTVVCTMSSIWLNQIKCERRLMAIKTSIDRQANKKSYAGVFNETISGDEFCTLSLLLVH